MLKTSIIALALAWATAAYGQDRTVEDYSMVQHDHGQNGLPDWYDPGCCNQRDCKPVKDEDIEFVPEVQFGTVLGPAVRYKPTGNLFPMYQWRRSQDERYHVCINALGNSLCFYDRPGA